MTAHTGPRTENLVDSRNHLLGILLLEGLIALWLIVSARLPVHDTLEMFFRKYYFFNHVVWYGEMPFWNPFQMFGITTDAAYLSHSSFFLNFIELGGGALSVLRKLDFLAIFHVDMLFDQLFFVTGCWLFGSRLGLSPLYRTLAVSAASASAVWYAAPYFNFRAYYALPTLLYFYHRVVDDAQPEFAAAAINLLALQIPGSAYMIPVQTLALSAYICGDLVSRPAKALPALRALVRPKNILLILFSLLTVVLVFMLFDASSADRPHHLREGRLADGSATLDSFLNFAGGRNPNAWGEIFHRASWHKDNALYFGIIAIPWILIAAVTGPFMRIFPLIAAVAVLLEFADAGSFSAWTYRWWPTMKYYRHISFVAPITKLFLCFVAAIGFQTVMTSATPYRKRLLFAAVVTVIGFFFTWRWALPFEWGGMERSFLRTSRAAAPFWVAASFFGTALAMVVRFRSALAPFIVLTAVIDVYSYKVAYINEYTLPLSGDQRAITLMRPLPFAARRTESYETNSLSSQVFPDLVEITVRNVCALNTGMDAFFFIDQFPRQQIKEGGISVCEWWFMPFDRLIRAYEGIAWDDSSKLPGTHYGYYPFEVPAFQAVSGMTSDKIRLHNGAIRAPDTAIAIALRAPGSQGDKLFLSQRADPPRADAEGVSTLASPEIRPKVSYFSGNELHIEFSDTLPKSIWLAYSDVWHPGWKASVDGIAVPVERANLAFKAIELPAGSRLARFRFDSKFHSIAYTLLGINFGAWLIWTVYVIWKLVR